MAVKRNGTAAKYFILHNGVKLKKGYHNGTKEIWSAGSTVTYIVDTDKSYTEEVDYGATCLAPTTFTPSKDGWNFIGWREDTTASSYTLTNKLMQSDPITLYAVYDKDVTLTTIVDEKSTQYTDNAYYNASGSTVSPMFTVPNPTKDGCTFFGWCSTDGGDVVYDNITDMTLTEDMTLYASLKHIHMTSCYRTYEVDRTWHSGNVGGYCPSCGAYYEEHTYSCYDCSWTGWARTSNCTCGQTPSEGWDAEDHTHTYTEKICGFD